MSLDLPRVGPFMGELTKIGLGFGGPEAATVERMISELDPDEERELRFDVVSGADHSTLIVQTFLDDPGTVDVYLFGPAWFIARAEEAIEASMEM